MKKMSSEKDALQNAINRALKAANRAYKANKFGKVAELYYRIASMLNDLGDEAGAQNFSSAAKKFKEKKQIIEQINLASQHADESYAIGDFAAVAESYFQISSLSELIGDKKTAERFKIEAEKFAQTARIQPQMQKKSAPAMTEMAPSIQSQIPAEVEIKNAGRERPVNLDKAMAALGLVCPHCGEEIAAELTKCPHCKKQI
jgi:hypothetical protein